MTTQYQRLKAELIDIEAQLKSWEGGGASGNAPTRQRELHGLIQQIHTIAVPVQTLVAKASETDPDKQTYGKAMVSKVGRQAVACKLSLT